MSSLVEPAVLEPVDSASPAPLPPLRRLSIQEYEKLVTLEVIPADERVELLGGMIYTMSPINEPHADSLSSVTETLYACLGRTVIIREQSPIRIPALTSELQPDVVVAQRRSARYRDRHPQPEDIYLVVEVSDTSLDYDRRVKASLYAAAGIPDYIIVNLPRRRLEVLRDPVTPTDGEAFYSSIHVVSAGESVAPLHFPQCVIEVDAVMPLLDADEHG